MSENDSLTPEEKKTLLRIAREAIEHAVRGKPLPTLNLESVSPRLREKGASFVTLTLDGMLRGCIGALEPYQPLAADVQEHAVAAALQDFRFPPVSPQELPRIEIEVSRLTLPVPLLYNAPEELPSRLRPGIDGLILQDGWRRATFLPQVWEQLPEPEVFLSHLCQKMGAPANLWRQKILKASVYQVEEFRESGEV